MTAFGDADRAGLAGLYPETPGIVPHGLTDHPLLTLDALARLAAALPANSVEYNRGDLPIGVDPATVPANGLSPEETVRSIEENGSWMVLKRIEQDAAYAALLRETLAEIAPLVEGRTGKMLGLEGFIFVSSPNAVTPFHFDPEHNILLQIRGRKTMTVFPQEDAAIVDPEAHEAFHLGQHHRNLQWRDDFAAKGRAFDLEPGQAIHVPVKAPHWVKNGDAVSISLSVTWRSEWSYAEADARAFNHLLRKRGLSPAPPGRWPATNATKSLAYRALRKAGLAG
jgi:mannose-6-phosphate isomerase-like protein (cupin superfamily)